jgi:hypothetical protein
MASSVVQQLKRLWTAWKSLARTVGNFQARVLLTLIYATIVLPFGLMARLFSDHLHTKNRPTKWGDRPPEVHDLNWARRQ